MGDGNTSRYSPRTVEEEASAEETYQSLRSASKQFDFNVTYYIRVSVETNTLLYEWNALPTAACMQRNTCEPAMTMTTKQYHRNVANDVDIWKGDAAERAQAGIRRGTNRRPRRRAPA